MRGAGKKRRLLHYSFKGLGYLVRGVLRGLGLVFLFSVLLGLAAYLGLRVAFDEEKVKSIFVDQIQDILRRPVQIDKVLLTPYGVKLRGVRVVERSGVPGRYLLSSDTVLVTVKLSGLLRRRLELDQVKLTAPYIQLMRDEEGRWNVADILSSSHAARALPVGRLSLPFSLGAQRTVLSRGVIKVEDRFRKVSLRFENVELEARRFAVDRPFSFTLSCDNASDLGGRTIRSSLALEAEASLASFDWPRACLRATRAVLIADGEEVRGSGRVIGLPPAELDLEAQLPDLGPEQWKKYLGKDLAASLPASRWRLEAAFPAPWRVRVRRLLVESPPLSLSAAGFVDFSSAALKAEARLAEFPLSQARTFYPPWQRLGLRGVLSASVEVAGPWRSLRLRRGSLKLSRAGGRFPNFRVDGGGLSAAVAGNFDQVTFSVANGQGEFFSSPFSGLNVSAGLSRDDLEVGRFALRLGGSRIALKARVRGIKDPKEVAITGSADRVVWEEAQALAAGIAAKAAARRARAGEAPRSWVRTFKYVIPRKFPDTVGHITVGAVAHKNFSFANADLLWDIRGVSPTLRRVSGDVRVSFGPGRIHDIPAVQAANKFLKIIFLPFIYMHKMNNLSVFSTATAYPKTLDFNLIEGEYGLRQGAASTRLFYVDSPQMAAFADGTADFGKETVDMMILTRLTGYRQPLPEWWVDELGRPAIAFRVKGDLNLPELEPRLTKMAGDEIEKALAEARAKAKKRYTALDKLRKL